nr:hypothetical protein [uncultured Haemophilus sp.]
MKKLAFLLGLSVFLTACAGSNDIAAARGANSSTISSDELNQYRKQRANETEESVNQATKAAAYSSTIHSGASAIQSGVSAIQSVRGLFGF